jgi:hypothetical protein
VYYEEISPLKRKITKEFLKDTFATRAISRDPRSK